MPHPEEKTPHEKLKLLLQMAVAELEHVVHQFIESPTQPTWVNRMIENQLILIDLLEKMLELEEPE